MYPHAFCSNNSLFWRRLWIIDLNSGRRESILDRAIGIFIRTLFGKIAPADIPLADKQDGFPLCRQRRIDNGSAIYGPENIFYDLPNRMAPRIDPLS